MMKAGLDWFSIDNREGGGEGGGGGRSSDIQGDFGAYLLPKTQDVQNAEKVNRRSKDCKLIRLYWLSSYKIYG